MFSDNDARLLLQLLHKYVTHYDPDVPPQVEHLAGDLAQSLDVTSDEDDRMYQEIANIYRWDHVSRAPQDKWPGEK
jgi:hypothetical protein